MSGRPRLAIAGAGIGGLTAALCLSRAGFPVDVFERALAQEQEVSRQIDALYELALKEKVFAAMAELHWFITEQVEEEKTVREIVAKFHMVKDDPASILDLDRELGGRGPEAGGDEPS